MAASRLPQEEGIVHEILNLYDETLYSSPGTKYNPRSFKAQKRRHYVLLRRIKSDTRQQQVREFNRAKYAKEIRTKNMNTEECKSYGWEFRNVLNNDICAICHIRQLPTSLWIQLYQEMD